MEIERIECEDINWRVSVTLGSDKMANIEETKLQLHIQGKKEKQGKVIEFTIEEAEEFLEELVSIAKEIEK
ncbi:hypothetical protein EHI8A_086790 [Entamoeba histolytica HM-1:IMSS-B]|uniref:COMM domain-containing protein n=6 Tax=Entamoeba histolytica TaxID=5759 RepID=B1N4A3_ENTH1|nr:hypothetical protein EHI_120300 [Entamoeba histolytica HM-1:IMSS]EMD42782.1 Hypothetical protein EHI5A_006420 [Entamoeba histolytica KU27]EMH76247.1 hypothetical protein EHI8A_086790 [Entamoeba histolytica HM-1:IMSS-B]EMS16623.1 hypothetical protein KM1_004590 [Entamoeba histolytica HM-3:IMSS]ENY60650.1 hypothetical protein EHI7A_024400 [Entamoeba histolytica HM-1:IMSS-A]GAT97908.1 hypothetical protein CL6EHI_120300 [Entamoeba histolytica]|eukprot:XP_001914017.1 hypothetical protein EHI_120300 [Entamoeba histolytica HM-1:IMSS]